MTLTPSLYQVFNLSPVDDECDTSSDEVRQGVHYEVIGAKDTNHDWVVCRVPKCKTRAFQSLERYLVHAQKKHGLGIHSRDSDSDHCADVAPTPRNLSRRKPPGHIRFSFTIRPSILASFLRSILLYLDVIPAFFYLSLQARNSARPTRPVGEL